MSLVRNIMCSGGCNNIHKGTLERFPFIVAGFAGVDRDPKDYSYTYRYNCPTRGANNIEMKVTVDLSNKERRYKHGKLKIEEIVQTNPLPPVDAIATPTQESDKVLLEFGKDVVKNSLESIRKFDEFMVPLTTGLITVYFALLKFLNIETYLTLPNTQTTVTPDLILQPTYVFLISLTFFIASCFPILRKLSIDSISSINSYRKQLILWRYGWTVIASGLFLYGIYLILEVVESVLKALPPISPT